jgi:hypothetical protein
VFLLAEEQVTKGYFAEDEVGQFELSKKRIGQL